MTYHAGGCVAPLLQSEAKVIKCGAVDKKTLAAGSENSYELRREIQDVPKRHFLLPYLFFGSPTLFLGVLEFLNVEVYPDPVQQRPIACAEAAWPAAPVLLQVAPT
jgi:hypothetical protein